MQAHGLTGELILDDGLELDPVRDDDEPRPGGWELASLVVLVVAGTGLPIAGWLVGIAMVHLSDVWTERDTRIAVVAPGIAVALAVIAAALAGNTGVLILDLGPLAVFLFFGGAIAGITGGAYLTWRAFALS
jgi:hypothetical protein